MPITVYTNPDCNASLKACYRLRQMGVKYTELPMPADEMGLVRMLSQAASCLPVLKIGDHEYHDYSSGLRKLKSLAAIAQSGGPGGLVPPPRVL